VQLALESQLDGVENEGRAADQLAARAASATNPVVANVLRSISRDEREHALLGEDIVTWCRDEHPALVGSALRAAGRRGYRSRMGATGTWYSV
jgi:hypothetical protein